MLKRTRAATASLLFAPAVAVSPHAAALPPAPPPAAAVGAPSGPAPQVRPGQVDPPPVTSRHVAFTMPLPTVRSAMLGGALAVPSTGPVEITPTAEPVPVRDGVAVIGATWAAGTGADTRLEYRVRTGGHWGPWEAGGSCNCPACQAARVGAQAGPETASTRAGTQPIVITGAEQVQARLTGTAGGAPREARLSVIDPGAATAADAAAATDGSAGAGASAGRGASAAPAAGTAMRVHSRASWGASESLAKGPFRRFHPVGVAVHNTDGTNSYSAAQVPAILRGIQRFHIQDRGWSDIGYNALVDKWGRVWEGRRGGIDRPVQGAHAAPYNGLLVGISVMGSHNTAKVSDAAVQAVAWGAGRAGRVHRFEPNSSTTMLGKRRPRVLGHGDVNNTDCPGRYLHAKLPRIRALASTYRRTGGAMVAPTPPAPKPKPTPKPKPKPTPKPVTPPAPLRPGAVTRSGGRDRYETAVAVSRAAFTPGRRYVFVARGDTFPDALSVGPLAGRVGAPILLTPRGRTPAAVTAELARLRPQRIYVLGGPSALPETQLRALARWAPQGVGRIAGADRYATAADVAQWWDTADTVYLASGLSYPDAVSGGAAAATTGAPVLLTDHDRLPAQTAAALRRLRPARVVVVGGPRVVSARVAAAARVAAGGGTLTRLAGADRFATSAAVAAAVPGRTRGIVLVSGLAFPDALTAVPAARRAGAALVLSRRTCLPTPVAPLVARATGGRWLIGGASAISTAAAARRCR